jgi:hypothetical protein
MTFSSVEGRSFKTWIATSGPSSSDLSRNREVPAADRRLEKAAQAGCVPAR